jgi:6-phosphogluconolactonase
MSLLRRATAAAAILFAAATASADEYWVYYGTYTGGKNGSKGIYRSKLDNATGKLSEAELAAEMGSPSFVAIHPNGKFLYAVGEGNSKDGGPVVAFALDAKTGQLAKLNEGKSGGPGPCFISVHPKGTHVIVANYGGGSTAVFSLGADGKIIERTAFVQHQGTGKDKGRQEKAHAHCAFFDRARPRAYTVDLGIDRVKVFAFDAAKGTLNDDAADDIPTPPGSGPRHITFASDGKFAYVCGELDSTVNTIEFMEKGGRVVQSLSTLSKPVKNNSTAECILSPSGKFVYVSNRVGDNVAVFRVGDDRKLGAAGHITGDIKIPRGFNIEPSGKWMLIASQDGGKVGVWELDSATGMGKETGTIAKVDKCVCVKFVPVAK